MLHAKRKILFALLFATSIFTNKSFSKPHETLTIGAIPDQNPEILNRLYKVLSNEISDQLDVKVQYKPVISYPAAVTAFRTGNLDLVWFGGLTGVQARLQTKGSQVLAQREIDAKFHSVFIANSKSGLPKINRASDLKLLKGKRFLFGSESSTSGRLMPQHYLNQSGVQLSDFVGGNPGFSGSHDATIKLVESGTYEAGALNEQVWKARLLEGKTNPSKVKVIWRTPPYHDYHWLARPDLDKRFGNGFTSRLRKALISFNKENPRQKIILEAFGAEKFITSGNKNYVEIEKIGRKIGKIK